MANFVKVGIDDINLDTVSRTRRHEDGSITVYFISEGGGGPDYINLEGEEATALRRWLDRVATDLTAPPAPECETCNDSGTIRNFDGGRVNCPACDGAF